MGDLLSLWVRVGRQEAPQTSHLMKWVAQLVPQTLACPLTSVTADKLFEAFETVSIGCEHRLMPPPSSQGFDSMLSSLWGA